MKIPNLKIWTNETHKNGLHICEFLMTLEKNGLNCSFVVDKDFNFKNTLKIVFDKFLEKFDECDKD